MSCISISEDNDSLSDCVESKKVEKSSSNNVVNISSDDDETETYMTSDEDDLPAVNLKAQKSAVIKKLFPTNQTTKPSTVTNTKPSTSTGINKYYAPTPKLKVPGFEKMIGGVKVQLPVNPYGSQIVLMFKLITAINKGQNCLLESPTGSGKTLALLCGALAWQHQEKSRIVQQQAQQYFNEYPQLNGVQGAAEYITSPLKNNQNFSDFNFGKTVFGEKSIYDQPAATTAGRGQGDCTDDSMCCKRDGWDTSGESPCQVTLHKKRKLDSSESPIRMTPEQQTTPTKMPNAAQPETPQSVRALYGLVENLHLRVCMFASSTPTIYYGARTHKQLQQVIKEFSRTWYCGEAEMTLLSSREYSCIREFDKQMWGTKNDMCRGCTKRLGPDDRTPKKGETNCAFYDNREALGHSVLPAAFDLEDLVAAGTELKACPYYAARAMVQTAQIVFCPYNYLIEPSIRNSMNINLQDSILIIDEAHNIEDICRDAATFTFTKDNILAAITELETVVGYKFSNQDVMSYVEHLLKTLKNWDDWFRNQMPIMNNKPVNNNESVHTWEMEHFVQTLNNHNIGQMQYAEFSQSAEIFCRKLREDPRPLFGVTQATGSLIESINIVIGYLFREEGKYKDDFKPALIRTVSGVDGLAEARGWRNSQFNQRVSKETLSLRLLCMSPAVVFEGLKSSRCIILASGTLTPLVSLHSELATEFPLQVSPNHVIPSDRVWIGTLTTCPNGRPLECTSRGADQPDTQDALGQAVLWVTQVTPNGVLVFLPSYMLMNKLHKRWQETGLWNKLCDAKHVFMESRNVRDHNDIMDDYYKYASSNKGALLFAVYRGKVSEGMDFKDEQARAVITVGVPYPNTFDMAVKEKMKYNDKYSSARKLLTSREWLRVQAYRALNQAVGRCVRHRRDWGAVLLADARFTSPYYTEHLSKWVRNFLGNNHHTFESLVNSPNSLETFMQSMAISENEEQ